MPAHIYLIQIEDSLLRSSTLQL